MIQAIEVIEAIEAWALFWKMLVYGAVGLFAVMSLWVSVAGYYDIKKMFRALREAAERGEDGDR